MKIMPIASGSSGNCYYVSDGETNILLDCGIPVQKIKEFLWNEGKRLSDIDACLVTHSHGDHVKSAKKLASLGIAIYSSKQTADISGLDYNTTTIEQINGRVCTYGFSGMSFYPFFVKHDAPGTLSFLIWNTDRHEIIDYKILYVTDTPYFPYKINGVTHLMIEANNDPNIIAQNVSDGKINASHAARVVKNHMSIETCLKTIERMDRSKLKEIWLLHLSKDNAGDDFKRRVQEVAGCEVYVA